MHILDIAENSVAAQAEHVFIRIEENSKQDIVVIEIEDDGIGMDENIQKRALDPFSTTKPEKKVGLGLSLLADAARKTGGNLELFSSPGRGTRVRASFGLSHVDRQPFGDMVETIVLLVIGNPHVEFTYRHTRDEKFFFWSTDDIRTNFGEISRSTPEVVDFIRENVNTGLQEIA
jgi:hypothetical protein